MLRANRSVIESDFSYMPSFPKDFHTKLLDLELQLEKGYLTHESLKELFDCYSVNNNFNFTLGSI